jgi:hypothetical protein
VSVTTLTMLEPLLGVVNCSLPLLRPVGQNILACLGKANALRFGNARRTSSSQVLSIGHPRRVPRTPDPYCLDLDTTHGDVDSQIDLCSLSANNDASETGSREVMKPHAAC